MEPVTPWYADRDPETGELFVSQEPFYTWASGWGYFEPSVKFDEFRGEEYLDIVPAITTLGKGAPFNYAVTRIPLSEDEAAPRPAYIRPLSLPPMLNLMLHIIAEQNGPTIPGPFVSGLVRKGAPNRLDKYIKAINGGAPTDFAIVVREEAQRWRQRADWSTGEQLFMKRLFWDMRKEIQFVRGVPRDEANTVLQRAFGGNPFLRATVKMRKPKTPKSGKK